MLQIFKILFYRINFSLSIDNSKFISHRISHTIYHFGKTFSINFLKVTFERLEFIYLYNQRYVKLFNQKEIPLFLLILQFENEICNQKPWRCGGESYFSLLLTCISLNFVLFSVRCCCWEKRLLYIYCGGSADGNNELRAWERMRRAQRPQKPRSFWCAPRPLPPRQDGRAPQPQPNKHFLDIFLLETATPPTHPKSDPSFGYASKSNYGKQHFLREGKHLNFSASKCIFVKPIKAWIFTTIDINRSR